MSTRLTLLHRIRTASNKHNTITCIHPFAVADNKQAFSSSSSAVAPNKKEVDAENQTSRGMLSYMLPNPQPNPPEIAKAEAELERQRAKKRVSLLQAFKLTWRDYKQTWEGFFDNHKTNEKSKNGEDDNEEEEKRSFLDDIDEEKIIQGQKDVRKNVKRNIKAIKNEGTEAIEAVKDLTGISNKEDLTKWAMAQLRLANECVGEFMKGYRTSRDEEIDKMINVYFKDFEEDSTDDKKKLQVQSEAKKQSEIKPGRRNRRRKSKWQMKRN